MVNKFGNPTPYLYILMRNDLDSLNPGKMVAQGAHAANQFTYEMKPLEACIARRERNRESVSSSDFKLWRLYDKWIMSTSSGFGVTISLGVNGTLLHTIVNMVNGADLSMCGGVTHDPSYPLMDGKTLHLLPLDTCAYIFGDKDELQVLLGQFDLLP
jgi:hypothetical protein